MLKIVYNNNLNLKKNSIEKQNHDNTTDIRAEPLHIDTKPPTIVEPLNDGDVLQIAYETDVLTFLSTDTGTSDNLLER